MASPSRHCSGRIWSRRRRWCSNQAGRTAGAPRSWAEYPRLTDPRALQARPGLCGGETFGTAQCRGAPETLAAESPLALLKRPDGAEKIDLAKRRPVRVAEVELAEGALPEHEAGKTKFAARANDQIRIRTPVGVEILLDSVRGQRVHDLRRGRAPGKALLEIALHRVHDFLPAAVPDTYIEDHPLVITRRGLGEAQRPQDRRGEQVQPTNRADPDAGTHGKAARHPFAHLSFDHLEDRRHIIGIAVEILDGQPPESDHGNPHLEALAEDCLRLRRPPPVSFPEVAQPGFPAVAPVAILDHPEVLRQRSAPELGEETSLIEVVQRSLHRQRSDHDTIPP